MTVIRGHRKRNTINKKPKGVAIFTVVCEGAQVLSVSCVMDKISPQC